MIATRSSIAVTDIAGDPFNSDFNGWIGQLRCNLQDAAWYLGIYLALRVSEEFNCSYWFNKI